MEERWYRADFEAEINGEKHYPDSEYFVAKCDEHAISYAKQIAREGWDYADVDHHVEGKLVSVTLVDSENEWNDIKTISMDGYSPVNNILVIKGDADILNAVLNDSEVKDRFSKVTDDTFHVNNISSDGELNEVWIYYETNGEPYEEVPEFIKKKYPKLRVFFSSIDYDEWCFAYYKEFGVNGEYNYHTRNDEKIDKIFNNFVSN